jgi:hypothetical protein
LALARRCVVAFVLAIAFAEESLSLARAAEFEIKITFDQTFDRIAPNPKLATTHYEMAATLSSSGQVSHSERHFFEGAKIFSIDTTMRLGGNASLEWRVVNRNALVDNKEYPSFVRTILVTIHDQDCVAQVRYQLKPGYADYRYHSQPSGDPAVARSVRADNVACAIEQGSQR